MNASATPMQQIKDSMRPAWMAGDFGVVAKTISADAENFVRRLGILSGTRVLDVACGTGNTAIPLARQGAEVTGVDIAANLIAQARERAADEGLTATFDEGDAELLPYADASFDAVVTMFGAMFAPRPELVASEAARVLKPGGLLAMANWNPASFSAQMFKVGGRQVPPPLGIAPPVLWGNEDCGEMRLQYASGWQHRRRPHRPHTDPKRIPAGHRYACLDPACGLPTLMQTCHDLLSFLRSAYTFNGGNVRCDLRSSLCFYVPEARLYASCLHRIP